MGLFTDPVEPDVEEVRRADVEARFIRAFTDLAQVIHEDNVAKGFWPDDPLKRNVGEALFLTVTELSEGFESYRKHGFSEWDRHVPQFGNFSVEIADAIIRLMDLSRVFAPDVAEALVAKLRYNRTRPHKHGKSC